jgi:SAM-dependent methyltransferase
LAEPSFDLDYSIDDFEVDPHRDGQFLFQRMEEVMLREGLVADGRTLDVACGVGRLAAGIRDRGGEGWGLEPSQEMLGLNRWLYSRDQVVLVRGIAEALPFRTGGFDRVICQGSLDHFVDPHAFMREAARVLRPGGRVVIALTNYEGLSCQLGRFLFWLASDLLRRPQPPHRPYWQPPPDHHHKGEFSFVRRLGGKSLQLEHCSGVSLLWPLYGWGKWLDRLPRFLADALLVSLDRIAYRTPALADTIVSVWQPRNQQGPR